jgi:succinate dehydrogenase / fumarate reductase flavoprotein subunit
MMGGVRVDADSEAATVPGLFACGEVAGGMHGANRLGGNSLSDLLVFGRRAGIGAVEFASGRSGTVRVDEGQVSEAIEGAVAPFTNEGGENPYDIQHDLQDMMHANVGIIRTADEIELALRELDTFATRIDNIRVAGGRAYNPGWNLATDLPSMLTVSRCTALGARARKESRGGHTREDYPKADPTFGKINFAHSIPDARDWRGTVKTIESPLLPIPEDLAALLEDAH